MLFCVFSQCGFSHNDRSVLADHYLRGHGFYLCDRVPCLSVFRSEHHRRIHVEAVHSGLQFRCSVCRVCYKQPSSFYKHRNSTRCGGFLEKISTSLLPSVQAVLPVMSNVAVNVASAQPIYTSVIAGCSTSLSNAPVVLSSHVVPSEVVFQPPFVGDPPQPSLPVAEGVATTSPLMSTAVVLPAGVGSGQSPRLSFALVEGADDPYYMENLLQSPVVDISGRPLTPGATMSSVDVPIVTLVDVSTQTDRKLYFFSLCCPLLFVYL